MIDVTVTRLASMLSWNGKKGLFSHHYHEAPELGQHHHGCTDEDREHLKALETRLLEAVGPRTYRIGARCIQTQPQMEWYQLRFFRHQIECEATVRHGDACTFHRFLLHDIAPEHDAWVKTRHNDCHEDHGLDRYWPEEATT